MAYGNGCPLCAEEAYLTGQLALVLDLATEEPALGAWCPWCALPSAASWPIEARCDHGWPQPVTVPDVVVCLDCQRTVVALQAPPGTTPTANRFVAPPDPP